MDHPHVSVELTLLLPYVRTEVTGVPHPTVFIVNMSVEHLSPPRLVVALVAGVHLPFMFLHFISIVLFHRS